MQHPPIRGLSEWRPLARGGLGMVWQARQTALDRPVYDGEGDPLTQVDGLWIQHPTRQFTDQAGAWGVDEPGISRGVVLADIDNDGWLDVLKRVLDTTSPLHISRCGDAAWARIRLEAPGPNTAAVGARLRITAGGLVHTRWITSGSTGMYSGSPIEAHVGLGAADTIDRIDVIRPDGATSHFEHVPSRQKLTIVRDP